MRKLVGFPYKKVLILGLAKSGTAAAQLLLNNGVEVTVNDFKAENKDTAILNLISQGAHVVLGSHPLSVLDDIEVLIKNPGIPYDNIIVKEAGNRKIPIITEVELVAYLHNGPIIGITGSNGKTTTTTLIGEMLSKSDVEVKVAGNIGKVASEVAQTVSEKETMVIELSSFQLLGIQKFKPRISLLLNIFESHLDYHQTMENYIHAKEALFLNQSKEDYLIYNADDALVRDLVQKAKATLVPFSTNKKVENGAWLYKNSIYFKNEKIIDLSDVVLVGDHNIENILAAICAAKLSGATNNGIYQVLTTFQGVKHRLQFVKDIKGRLFYNDSKATNTLATEKALAAFNKPIILLAGGLDRGNEFDDLIPYLQNVKAMIVFGETAQKLKRISKEADINEVIIAKNMNEAVKNAYDISVEDDVILLSPACASWDQYKTFEERGDMFIESVHKLA